MAQTTTAERLKLCDLAVTTGERVIKSKTELVKHQDDIIKRQKELTTGYQSKSARLERKLERNQYYTIIAFSLGLLLGGYVVGKGIKR